MMLYNTWKQWFPYLMVTLISSELLLESCKEIHVVKEMTYLRIQSLQGANNKICGRS